MAAIEVSQSSLMPTQEKAQQKANGNPASNQVLEQSFAELKDQNQQLEQALKKVTKNYEKRIMNLEQELAAMKAKLDELYADLGTPEKQSRKEILKALDEDAQRLFHEDCNGFHSHLLRIVHTCDSITFIRPGCFHLCFRKQGRCCVIQPENDVLRRVTSTISFSQLVEVFLSMLFSKKETGFVNLMLELKGANNQFLQPLVKILEARDGLMKVKYLYTNKLLLKSIAKFINPEKCQSITILENEGEGEEEIDEEVFKSPIWRKLRRFVCFEEFSICDILMHCEHIPEVHVILKERKKIEQILELKLKLLQSPHLAHVSFYFKSGPLSDHFKPAERYSGQLGESSQLCMTVNEYCVEFHGPKYTENGIEAKIIRELFVDVIEKRESNLLVTYIMDQREEEAIKLLRDCMKANLLRSNDPDEEDERTPPSNNNRAYSPISTTSSDGVDYESSSRIVDAAMEEVTIVFETLDPIWRDNHVEHREAQDDLFADQAGPSGSKTISRRCGEPMKEPESSKKLKLPEEKSALEQSHDISQKGPNVAPEEVPQDLEPVDQVPRGIEQNEDSLEDEQQQNSQQSNHELPASNLSEMLRSLQETMERSSDEYRTGCLVVLNAAVSRFSGPNPPQTASEFFDEMIRRFQESSHHNS